MSHFILIPYSAIFLVQDSFKRAMKAGGAVLEAARPPYNPSVIKRVDFAVVPHGKGANIERNYRAQIQGANTGRKCGEIVPN